MEMEPMLSKKPKTNGDEKEKRREKEKKEKGNGSDSDSSGEECGTVRTHRISNTLRPRITGFTPSPRVSTTSQPSPLLLEIREKLVEKEEEEAEGIAKAVLLRLAGAFLVVLSILLIVVVIYLATKAPEVQYCHFHDSDHVTPRDLKNPDVFDDLSEQELKAVNDFMLNNKALGLTTWEKATIDSSYIFMIDLFLPNKGDVLQYLDHGSKKPKREAKVTVVRGNRNPPVVEEYVVSPLPKPKSSRLFKDPSFRRHPIPYTSRPIDDIDYKFIFPMIEKLTEELYPLLMESYGLCYHNCTEGLNCMVFFDVSPRGFKSGERKSWTWGFPEIDGFYIHPLGFEFLIDHTSTDVSKWIIEKIVYNGQPFDSAASLMRAYNANNLTKIHLNINKEYSSYVPKGEISTDHKQGPKLTEPEGKRFKVTGRQVSYNKWNFNVHMKPSVGPQIFDIRFEGTRIAYELSLQEVLVFYSGYGPSQTSTNYYDVSWSIGASNMALVRGVDCPDTAIFLDTDFWVNLGRTQKFKNNICIFEENGGMPQRRHFANNFEEGYYFYGGLVDYHLVVRTVANVWNYDYLFDYIFYPGGAIEVRATATGYVQSTFNLPKERKYGSVIHDHVVADVHHHIFNYKVDLDIAGEKNRYTTLDIELETIQNPWVKNVNKTQMKITPRTKQTENKTVSFDPNIPQYHLFHNNDAKNHNGEDRSYRILNRAPSSFILENTDVARSAQWAKYPIAVTKRKDGERSSTSIFAQNDPWDPIINFDDFLDGENIVDQDLVAWVTMGVHHIPGTEDVPSTPTTWNRYSFFLQPHNYFSECPTVNSADVVVIRPGKDKGKPNVDTFGTSMQSTCIPKTTGPYEFDGDR